MIENILIYLKLFYSKKGTMTTQQLLIMLLATTFFVVMLFVYVKWHTSSQERIEGLPSFMERLFG